MNTTITTTRVRTADGQIRYITSDEARKIHPGTIVRPFGGERIDIYAAHTTPWGETQLVDYYGEVIRLSDTTRVEILGYFNI